MSCPVFIALCLLLSFFAFVVSPFAYAKWFTGPCLELAERLMLYPEIDMKILKSKSKKVVPRRNQKKARKK